MYIFFWGKSAKFCLNSNNFKFENLGKVKYYCRMNVHIFLTNELNFCLKRNKFKLKNLDKTKYSAG